MSICMITSLCNSISYYSSLLLNMNENEEATEIYFLYYSTLEVIFFILKETPCSYNPLEILRPRPSSTALILFLSSTMSRGTLTSISTSSFNFFESTNLTQIFGCSYLSTLPSHLLVIWNLQYHFFCI